MTTEFFKNFISSAFHYFSVVFFIIGCIVGFLYTLKQITETIPSLKRTWVNYLKRRAEKSDFKEHKKIAIKADIENVINSVTSEIRKELPKDWIRKVNIEWLEKSEDINLKNNEIILRIKPLKNQDDNVLNATYSFFKSTIFPKVSTVIPNSIIEASALKITHRVIDSEKPFLTKKFENEIIESAIQKDKDVARYFGNFRVLDTRGFFTSFFLREIDTVAQDIRMDERRLKIGEEIDSILKHVISFSNSIYEIGENTKEDDWIRKGFNSYAFLLVAKDTNQNVNAYVNRAVLDKNAGIKRLYVLGRTERMHFTGNVIKILARKKGFTLLDTYKLSYDYKGNSGGKGAIFEIT